MSGWTVGVHGYDPVPILDPMAPKELLQFTSYNCHGIAAPNGAVARRTASSVSLHVEFAKALHSRIASMMAQSLEKTQTLTFEIFDSWSHDTVSGTQCPSSCHGFPHRS